MTLKINGLSSGYRQRTVLQQVSLPSIEAGLLVALIGPNGVGKSTLVRSLAGLQPAAGQVQLAGADLLKLSPRERQHNVAYLPQTLPQATSLVVYEMLLAAAHLGAEYAQEQIETAITRVAQSLGITALMLRRLSELSGGQRQMVGLAQVLVRQAPLLLLDEPTSALDLRWQLNVLEVVRRHVQESQAIALVASHDLNLALRFADQVIMLAPGGECRMGKPLEVVTAQSLRACYGVEGRVETCSQGFPVVLVDGVADQQRQ
tara:strand:- start:25571 stop:26353 length:783 start_codon:yes stop_codon:yes gene_type:complete